MRRIAGCGVLVGLAVFSTSVAARDRIEIVGSSTVFPFAQRVAERFTEFTGYDAPIIRSTGTGKGAELFCEGLDDIYPDIVSASRVLTHREFSRCIRNGVREIVEVKIGYDGIVLANARNAPYFNITLRQLHLALAKTVPRDGKLVANPYNRWVEISSTLPAYPIRVYGPPATSGTRDAFIELALERVCAAHQDLNALKQDDASTYKDVCQSLREDGIYVEAGEDDQLIVDNLSRDKTSLGIFGFSFLDQNREIVKGSDINGIAPSYDTIYLRQYPLSRALYIYVKKDHIERISGLREYVTEFIDEWTWGPEGDLRELGLIPMPIAERKHFHQVGKKLKASRYSPAFSVEPE